MACPALQTGENFLAMALYHVDCQAQAIGAYGFGALADPASPVSVALTGLLTIFIAAFGLRLLLGYTVDSKDLFGDILRLGIALTMATSWPAWRVVGFDLIINGPQQIAGAIGLASQLPGSGGNFLEHLQRVDEGLAAMNVYGSGRLGVAQGDWFQLGLARSAFLIGTLAPLALIRLSAGILLAIAPLMAGLLLLGVSRPLFVGWVRGLVMVFLASIAATLVLAVELAMIEPWLAGALQLRAANEQVLDAPVEVMVITLVFAIVGMAIVAVMGWVAFHSAMSPTLIAGLRSAASPRFSRHQTELGVVQPNGDAAARAQAVGSAVAQSMRRDQQMIEAMTGARDGLAGQAATAGAAQTSRRPPRMLASDALGGAYRRGTRRVSQSGARRDGRQ